MKITYIDMIKAIEDETTKKIIGTVKIELLDLKEPECLFYIFPLIERMVLEIYKLVPGANIEQYEKSVMKTINSILKENNDLNVIPFELSKTIQSYFEEDGIRNKLFHVTKQKQVTFQINNEELNYIIMHLLLILKKMEHNYRIENLKQIERL